MSPFPRPWGLLQIFSKLDPGWAAPSPHPKTIPKSSLPSFKTLSQCRNDQELPPHAHSLAPDLAQRCGLIPKNPQTSGSVLKKAFPGNLGKQLLFNPARRGGFNSQSNRKSGIFNSHQPGEGFNLKKQEKAGSHTTGSSFCPLPDPEIPAIQELTRGLHLLFALDLPQVWVIAFKQKEKKTNKKPQTLCASYSKYARERRIFGVMKAHPCFTLGRKSRMCPEH